MGDGRFCFTDHALRASAGKMKRPIENLPKNIVLPDNPFQLAPPVILGEPLFEDVLPFDENDLPSSDNQG